MHNEKHKEMHKEDGKGQEGMDLRVKDIPNSKVYDKPLPNDYQKV